MSQLEFRLDGLTEEDRRQLERRLHRPPKTSVFPLILTVVIGGALIRNGLSGADSVSGAAGFGGGSTHRDFVAAHVAQISGIEVRADRLLLLIDNSGSMAGTDATVQRQIARLQSAGISVAHRDTVPGFAISSDGTHSLLRTVHKHLVADPSLDSIYVISDFSQGDESANTSAAYEDLVMTLRVRRIHLYWATVRDAPPSKYYYVARQTGGAVIPQ